MAAHVDARSQSDADAFYVKVTKDGTVDQKRGWSGKASRHSARCCEMHRPHRGKAADDSPEMERVRELGKWNDSGCARLVTCIGHQDDCWLTDIEKNPQRPGVRTRDTTSTRCEAVSSSLVERNRPILHVQLRRALTMAERGVVRASADSHMKFGKDAYSPSVLASWWRYSEPTNCGLAKTKRTPAMRMGPCRGPVAERRHPLYFVARRTASTADAKQLFVPSPRKPSQHEAGGQINEWRALGNSLTERLAHRARPTLLSQRTCLPAGASSSALNTPRSAHRGCADQSSQHPVADLDGLRTAIDGFTAMLWPPAA